MTKSIATEVWTPTKGLKNLFKAVLWHYFVYIDV